MSPASSEDEFAKLHFDLVGHFNLQVQHANAPIDNKCALVNLLLNVMDLSCCHSCWRCLHRGLLVVHGVIEFNGEPVGLQFEFNLPFCRFENFGLWLLRINYGDILLFKLTLIL